MGEAFLTGFGGGTARKVKHKLTAGSKNYDGSAAVTITAADLGALTSIPATYVTETEYATTSKGGVVKSSASADKVKVETDGTMSLNTVSASKIAGTLAIAKGGTGVTTLNELKSLLGNGLKIGYGSFTGTMVTDSTTTLNFEFAPKIIFLHACHDRRSGGWIYPETSKAYSNYKYSDASSCQFNVSVSNEGKTISWNVPRVSDYVKYFAGSLTYDYYYIG